MKTKPKVWSSYSYKLSDEASALDAPVMAEVEYDLGKMCATGLLATSTCRDRQGDILEVDGIDFTSHQRNPVVFVDHGQWYQLPIGKTVDPDGNYTVWVDGEDCYQTTYFSQKSEVAEQVFHLYVEKILRANSIGWRPIDTVPLKPDRATGTPPGLWIKKCELLEASWVGLPANQDAVMSMLSKDKICGKSLCPEVKAMLQPYILPKSKWVPVPEKAFMKKNKEYDEKDIPEGAVEEPADQPDDQTVDVDSVEPLGKTVVSTMSADLKDMVEQYSKEIGPVEHEGVKKKVGKHLEALKALCAKLDELHDSEYGEKDDEESEEETEEADDTDDEETEDETAEEEDKDDDEEETKDDEDEDKKSLKSLGKKLDTLCDLLTKQFAQKDAEDENLSAAEKKELAQLERAINRRMRLFV